MCYVELYAISIYVDQQGSKVALLYFNLIEQCAWHLAYAQ